MRSWVTSVQPDLAAIEHDNSAIATTSAHEDTAGLKAACSGLKRDIGTFEAAPPAPDAEARADVARWLDALSNAATQCTDGNFAAMIASLVSGNRYLARARDRINSLLPAASGVLPSPAPTPALPTAAHTTSAAAPSRSVTPTGPVTVINCKGEPPAVRPATLFFACADGGISVTRITWNSWGSAVATGSGMLNEQDCIPNCASGGYASEPAEVVLSQPQRVGGTTAYTLATVTSRQPNPYHFQPLRERWPQ